MTAELWWLCLVKSNFTGVPRLSHSGAKVSKTAAKRHVATQCTDYKNLSVHGSRWLHLDDLLNYLVYLSRMTRHRFRLVCSSFGDSWAFSETMILTALCADQYCRYIGREYPSGRVNSMLYDSDSIIYAFNTFVERRIWVKAR